MNRTTADSRDYDVVCMSFAKEKQKGIEVLEAGEKDNLFGENMIIHAGNSEILENGTIKTEVGQIIAQNVNFAQVKENNDKRMTSFAIEKAKREGKIKDFMKQKATRKEKEEAQELA